MLLRLQQLTILQHSTVTLSLSLIPLFFHPFLLHTLALRHHILSLFSLLFASSLPLSLFKIYWDARKYWGGGEAALNPMFTFKKKSIPLLVIFFSSFRPPLSYVLYRGLFLSLMATVGQTYDVWRVVMGGCRKDRGAWCVCVDTLDGNLDWHVEKKQWLQITYFSKLAHSSEIHLINMLTFCLPIQYQMSDQIPEYDRLHSTDWLINAKITEHQSSHTQQLLDNERSHLQSWLIELVPSTSWWWWMNRHLPRQWFVGLWQLRWVRHTQPPTISKLLLTRHYEMWTAMQKRRMVHVEGQSWLASSSHRHWKEKEKQPLVRKKSTHPWRMQNLLVANLTWQLMNEWNVWIHRNWQNFPFIQQFVQSNSSPSTKWHLKRRIEKRSNENPAISIIFCFFTRTERDFRDMAVGMHHGRGLQRLLSSSLFSVITLRQTVWLVRAETVHFDWRMGYQNVSKPNRSRNGLVEETTEGCAAATCMAAARRKTQSPFSQSLVVVK